ncbi:mucin-2-like isoform X6 [Tigriopus californicus]|uniref:mucin-2-like isoform X6 n=1 Tax=Tigriopus californicus TaxID=6832 RepID=UPI0027DA82F0|nr:mucin-2-like isoform X6 [Tigriopus californicus]
MLESSRLVIMANRSLSCFRDNLGQRYREEKFSAPEDKVVDPIPDVITEASQSSETLDKDHRYLDLDKERKTDMPGSETVPAAWRAWVNTNPAESAPQEVINPSEEQGKRSVIYIELANNSPAIKRRTQDAAPGNNKENKGDSRKPSVTPRISGENVERKYTVQTRTSDIVDVDKVISESLGGNGIHAKRVDEPPVQGRSFADKRSAQKTSVPKSALRESFLKAKDKFAGMNSASSKPPEPISLPKALEEKLVTTWKANQIKSPLELNDAHGSGMDPRKLLRLQSLDFESSVKNLSDGPQSPYTPDWDDQTGPNFQRTYSLVYKPVYAGKSVVSYSSSIRAKNITGKYRHAKNNQPVMKELKFHNFEEITDTDAPTLMRAESFSTPTLKRPKSDVMVYEIEETPNGPQSSTPHIDMPSLDDVEATRRVKPEDLDLTESNPELGHPSEFSSPKFIDRFSFITSPKPYKSFDSKSNSSQPSCSESDGPLWSPESFVQSRGLSLNAKDNTSIREETAMDLVESSLPVPVHHRHSVSQDSNDSSSSSPGTILPPTYSRLPPDGHEFPPDYKDPSSLTSQNSLLLTRKSSSESNSSDQSQNKKGIMDFPRIKMQKIQLIRHDENSIKSVRDKIALFSSACSSQSTEDLGLSQLGRNPPNTGLLTRAHTHGDVRYVGNDSKRSGIYHQSMTNVSASHGGSLFHRETKSISSTSLINSEPRPSRSRLSHGTGHTPTPQERHGRSQSLLEIGSTNASVKSPDGSSTLPKRHHPQPARRATLTTSTPIKKSDIKIIHENSPCLDSKELSEAKQIDLSGDRLKLSSTSSPNGRSSNKFSPAFKHKAFTIYSNTSSPSPPSSLKTDEKDVSSQFRNVPITQTGSPYQDEGDGPEDPRVLKRNSVEAINRRNILESAKKSSGTKLFGDPTPIQATKTSISDFRAIEAREVGKMGLTPARSITSLGKPASRSSSFTIAERKKSFETVSGTRTALESRRGPHSSQDSLRSAHSKENFNDASSTCSRRSSRDTICEEELLPSYSRRSSRSEADGGSRVTTPTRTHPLPGVDEGSRSTTPLGRRTLSRNNSLTSERSTYSKRSGASSKNGRDKTTLPTAAFPEQEKLSRNNSNDSGTSSNVLDLDLPIPTGGFSRLSSAVSSKDSGFPESEKSSFSRLSSIASVDEESLVSSPNTTPSVNNDKWSTLEKKYSISTQSMISTDTKTKIAQFSKTNTSTSSPVSSNATTSVRPTELNFHSVKSASNSPPPSLPLKKTSSTTTLVASPVSSRNFRELTEKFESKTSESATSSRRASITSVTSSSANYDESLSSSITSFRLGDKTMNYATWLEETKNSPFFLPEDSTEWESFDPSTPSEVMTFAKSKAIIKNDRKFSVPTYSSNDHANGVKMRDKKDQNAAPSRPSRLIESGASDLKVFEIGNLGEHRPLLSNSTSRGSSQADLLDCPDTPKSPLLSASMVQSGMQSMGSPQVPSRTSRELLDALDSKDEANRRCVSVNDIRRAFEKAEQSLSRSMSKCGSSSSSICGMAPCHNRMSSLDSTASDESSIPTPHYYGSVSSLLSGQTNMKDHYGSITSLASSTSMISPQELQGLIDEANQSLEESGTPSHEIMVIVLHREFTAGSIGITLAGGADYECKDITVHKVIPGTLADRDGRIQKGDRVLSINGRSTKGVSHREALSILKAPRAEVVLVLSRSRSVTPAETGSFDANYAASYNYVNMTSSRPPKILESPLDSKSLLSELKFVDVPRGAPMTVSLKKEGTGLGFRLEGGKDSPLGDRPLTIKKIFTGGAAGKSKVLKVGDEIISVNNTDCTRMSRIEAWNFMKKLSDGTSTIVVRQKIEDVKVKEPVQNCAIEVKAKTAAVTEKASPKQTPTA